jgi:hypothetical protein
MTKDSRDFKYKRLVKIIERELIRFGLSPDKFVVGADRTSSFYYFVVPELVKYASVSCDQVPVLLRVDRTKDFTAAEAFSVKNLKKMIRSLSEFIERPVRCP